MADRGQGFDFPEPEEFGSQSVSDPFAPGTEGTPEPGEERGALEVAEPEEPRRIPGMDKTQVQAGSMVNQQAIAEEEARAEMEQAEQEAALAQSEQEAFMDREADDGSQDAAASGEEAQNKESKTGRAFLTGSLFLLIFPPYGVYRLMKPMLAGEPADLAKVGSMIPEMCYPEMLISVFMLKNTFKYQAEYAPYSQGRKTIAQFLVVALPWIWWSIVIIFIALIALTLLITTICASGYIVGALCWAFNFETVVKVIKLVS
jgi:hypothetical protein